MKKYLFLAVAAVAVLASCSKNIIDPADQKNREINFATVANKATRAPITGTYYKNTDPAFGVFAYYLASGDWNTSAANSSAVSYMDDVEISFNDTKDIWVPSSTYYWPLEGKLTFIAYSPKSAASATFSNAGLLTLTGFTVNTTVASQADLLYSSLAANKTANESYYIDGTGKNSQTAEGDKGVNIKFKHALSQVIFQAKAADDVYDAGLSFKIDSIVVNAPSTAASMTVTNPTDEQLSSAITTWNNPSTPKNFIVSGTAFPADAYLTKTLSAPIGDPLLMIPLTSFDGTNYNIRIKYTLYRLDGNVNLGSKAVNIKFDNVDDVVTAWEAGKKYVYNLTIDLQKIYFNPTITDWDDSPNPQPVNVPNAAN